MFRVIIKSYFDQPEVNETVETIKELKQKYPYLCRSDLKKLQDGTPVVWDEFFSKYHFSKE